MEKRIYNEKCRAFQAETFDLVHLIAPTQYLQGQRTSQAMQDDDEVEKKNTGNVQGSISNKLLGRMVSRS